MFEKKPNNHWQQTQSWKTQRKNKNDVVEESIELANKISKNSPVAIKSAIQSTVSGLNQFYYDSFNIENNLFSSLFDSEDTKEGIDAFLKKRKPNFKGK